MHGSCIGKIVKRRMDLSVSIKYKRKKKFKMGKHVAGEGPVVEIYGKSNYLLMFINISLLKGYMIDRCVRKDSTHCDPSHITQDHRNHVMQLGSQRMESNLMHLSIIVFFLCGFIIFMYKILMKTAL